MELVEAFILFGVQVVERVGLAGLFRAVFAEESGGFGFIMFNGPT